MVSTTAKMEPPEPVISMAATMKTVATSPDRKLTRTGVPRRGWKRPKNPPKNAPSAAAIACMRSLMIIHAAPWVIRITAKITPVTVSMAGAAGP